jgi:putative SOS response-associated peptidase YedK
MCGRYATTRTSADLSKLFEALDDTEGELAPDYNLAPTDPAPIVRISTSQSARVLSVARFGLVPVWADDPRVGAKMINARVETVMTSRAYATPFERRRCLVPADGWYEWVRTGGGKQPYFMTAADGGPLAFAGLWTTSRFGLSCTILTAAATGRLTVVHDRMPLLLPPDRWDEWLTAEPDADLLAPAPAAYLDALEIRPVGTAVGDVRRDGPELIERVGIDADAGTKNAGTGSAQQTLF